MPVLFPIHPLAIYRCSFPIRNCHPWGLNPHVLSVSNSFPAVLVGLESPQLLIESQFSFVNHAKPNIWYLNSTFLWFKPIVLLLNFPSSRPLALILRPPELREAAWSWDELRLVMEAMVHLLRWFTEKKTLCFSVAMSNYQGHIVQFIMTKYGFAGLDFEEHHQFWMVFQHHFHSFPILKSHMGIYPIFRHTHIAIWRYGTWWPSKRWIWYWYEPMIWYMLNVQR